MSGNMPLIPPSLTMHYSPGKNNKTRKNPGAMNPVASGVVASAVAKRRQVATGEGQLTFHVAFLYIR